MRRLSLCAVFFMVVGCTTLTPEPDNVIEVSAAVETTPVESQGDAADDPAIWINSQEPAESLVLGTDKRSGLGVYDLDGNLIQFLPSGRLNNVDLRQGVTIGDWQGDLVAATNRSDDTVVLFKIISGSVTELGRFDAALTEPYGICMGTISDQVVVTVTHKTGEARLFAVTQVGEGQVLADLLTEITFDSQLEGCVHDDPLNQLFVGEEERGIWRVPVSLTDTGLTHATPLLIDEVEGPTGLAMDVEGLTLYPIGETDGYLIASSQGNNSFAVYERGGENNFLGRFRIADNPDTGIDGAQETDGIDATPVALGPDFPLGVLIVQDGLNDPSDDKQNFKIVDWREIKNALDLD